MSEVERDFRHVFYWDESSHLHDPSILDWEAIAEAGITRFVYKELRVNSHKNGSAKSMTNIDTDEAIIRMLASMPQVETLNLSNGKTYIEDILDSYEDGSEEKKRLLKWV